MSRFEENVMTKINKDLKNAVSADDAKPARLIGRPEVLDRTGLSYQSIWNSMRAGTFPPARAAGGKSLWLESEIEEWIAARPKRQYKTVEESARDNPR
jgi:predicted DNA-binding transcriptional regulator AlpA